jgi:DNA-binding LytR/AlgR family response regulator
VLVGDEDGINVCGQNIRHLQQLQQTGQAHAAIHQDATWLAYSIANFNQGGVASTATAQIFIAQHAYITPATIESLDIQRIKSEELLQIINQDFEDVLYIVTRDRCTFVILHANNGLCRAAAFHGNTVFQDGNIGFVAK